MKKGLVLLVCFGLLVSMASAQQLIGAKATGMGGAGVANVTDLSSVYYNPASLMRNEAMAAELKVTLGAAYSNPDKLVAALGKASDPATFLLDNYASNLSFSGSLNGVVGLNLNKIGLSVLPMASTTVSKAANSVSGSITAAARYDSVLTLGTSFSVPGLPAALDLGVNAKNITAQTGSITAAGGLTSASGTKLTSAGAGTGFDVGILTSFNVPMVTSLKVGAVMRDISETIKYTNKSQFSYINQTTGAVTTDAEASLPDSTTTATSTTALGASAVIPGVGITVAGDIEMASPDTNLHLGLEYPMLAGLLIARVGMASGPNLGLTTVGAKINLPFLTLDAAMITNTKTPDLSSAVVDINLGF